MIGSEKQAEIPSGLEVIKKKWKPLLADSDEYPKGIVALFSEISVWHEKEMESFIKDAQRQLDEAQERTKYLDEQLDDRAEEITKLEQKIALHERRIKELQAPEWAEGFRREGFLAAVEELEKYFSEKLPITARVASINKMLKQMKEAK